MYRKRKNVYLFSWDMSLFLLLLFVSQMKTFVFQMAIKKLKLQTNMFCSHNQWYCPFTWIQYWHVPFGHNWEPSLILKNCHCRVRYFQQFLIFPTLRNNYFEVNMVKLSIRGAGLWKCLISAFRHFLQPLPHQRLLRKPGLCGINGDIHTWISEFLCHRTQSVMVEGVRSHEDSVDSGVPQGTVLGPLLFLIYISDLPSVLDPDTAVRLFADDCLV